MVLEQEAQDNDTAGQVRKQGLQEKVSLLLGRKEGKNTSEVGSFRDRSPADAGKDTAGKVGHVLLSPVFGAKACHQKLDLDETGVENEGIARPREDTVGWRFVAFADGTVAVVVAVEG